MVYFTELPDNVKHNYRTLHHDIGMVQRSNGHWDLWFDNGDLVPATELHSLQVGIIIACLTSWNYLNRYGNPTYEVFGNRAYSLLKANKSSMVRYKIQQFFLECLKRMRRVYEVVYLEVYEVDSEPYKYFVEFEVISIDNSLVSGSFTVDDTNKSTSYLSYTYNQPYASPCSPLLIDVYLGNEYGGGMSGELVYLTVKGHEEDTVIAGVTDEYGHLQVEYVPTVLNPNCSIYFSFHGNSLFNGCASMDLVFQSAPFCFYVDDDSELYSLTSLDEDVFRDNVFIAEFVERYDEINYNSDIQKYYICYDTCVQEGQIVVMDYRGYIVFTGDFANLSFDDFVVWVENHFGEIHLFITNDSSDVLYMLDNDDDGKVYYIGVEEKSFD